MAVTAGSDVPLAAPAPAVLAGLIAERAPRVLVLGDALRDCWLSGPAHRLGRDAPVPVVELDASATAPGGAANVAANLAALGARVELVAVVGDDPDGRALRAELAACGVGTTHMIVDARCQTPVKRRIVAAGQTVARYDVGPGAVPAAPTCAALDAAVDGLLADVDAVVLADYDLGLLGPDAVTRLAARRDRMPLLVVDAHDPGRWAPTRPDLVTPSAMEAAHALGEPAPSGDRVGWAADRRHRLLDRLGAAEVLLTLDVDGAVLLTGAAETAVRRPAAHRMAESYACGAGDTFTAAATVAACVGADPATRLAVAQAAADVAVERTGTAVCGTDALTARLAAADRGQVLEHRELAAAVREHRRAGHRVVFTNGCFDVLHRGHVAYLRQARGLGDVLVVALNSDASVSRLKGPQRPVNTLADRAGVVGALDGVDLVTAFDADTPIGLIELLCPEIYAKGGDYTPQMLAETPVVERLGGRVRVLDYLSDHSTSAIVDRIRTAPDGAAR
ncbi:MAG TPA: D-glycero-beta-D-manno-heptose 1-phosphate adenylyltransferase [Pseudonocardia sp.]|nr:D-glycero-beta-D-manno-heptose 1-phosphate adenylyltransferase [Pseudonocardia sp.]